MTQTLEHTPDHHEPTEPPAATPWYRRRRWQLTAAGALVLALAGTGIGVSSHQRAVAAEQERVAAAAAAAEQARLAVLSDAVTSCDAGFTQGIDIGDGGQSVTIQTMSTKDRVRQTLAGTLSSTTKVADLDDVACILVAVDAPDAVVADMNATRALDGRQRAEWNDISASWSYHPDDGFNLVMSVA